MEKNRIKDIRKERGMTQVELAHKLGVTQGTIQKLENDQIEFSTKWMRQLALVLGVKAYELLPLDMQPQANLGNLTIDDICTVFEYMEVALAQKKLSLPIAEKLNLIRTLLEVAAEEPANQNGVNYAIEAFRKARSVS